MLSIYFQKRFFQSLVRQWKREYIVQQTLYQIEMQKKLKDKVALPKKAKSLVDEDFAEEEIIAQA